MAIISHDRAQFQTLDECLQDFRFIETPRLQPEGITRAQVAVSQHSGFIWSAGPFRQVTKVDRLEIARVQRSNLQWGTGHDSQQTGFAFNIFRSDAMHFEIVGPGHSRLLPRDGESVRAANLALEFDAPDVALTIAAPDVGRGDLHVFELGGDVQAQFLHRSILNIKPRHGASAYQRVR